MIMEIQMLALPAQADTTYFRPAQVTPFSENGVIWVYSGKGSPRRWGAPGVTTTIIVNNPDFVAIHVGFFHKHRGGQFWRYFVSDGQEIHQVSWRSLPDEQRQIVLDAYQEKAPSWAYSPGELRINSRAKRVLNELQEVLDGS